MNLFKIIRDYENSLDAEERRRKLLEFMEEVAVQLEFYKLDKKEQDATSSRYSN